MLQLIKTAIFLFICCFVVNISTANTEDIILQTKNGKIKGRLALNWDKNLYYSFTSVPYAKPPLNELRFKAPVMVEPWEDILNATNPAPMCPQFSFEELVGQEDCLYLNVYTPSLDSDTKLPVMVYIHGGGYFVGTGSSQVYGPEFLMTEKIILVTINYRLGYLGAISFKDQTQGVPGNAHMKDQVMALKWIQENIGDFGGDANLVTIFGESVGGASVHMHMLSPMSKGLVHRIIAQSGCATNPWSYGVLGTGDKIAKKLGITGTTKEQIMKLQEIPMEEFIKKTQQPGELGVDAHVPHEFSPVVETQSTEATFLPKLPIDLIPEASNNVPIMFGFNSNDTLIFQVTRRLYKGIAYNHLDDLDITIPHDLKVPNEIERTKLKEEIKSTFFKSKASIEESSLYAMGPWFITGYINALPKHIAAKHTVYFYMFSSDTKLNFYKRMHPVTAKYKGASHMDELGHLFTTENTPHFEKNSPEDQAWRTTVRIWTDFARYGQPAHKDKIFKSYIQEGLPAANSKLEVPKVTSSNDIVYVNIHGSKMEVLHEPDKIVFDFWRKMYEKYNE